MDEQENIMRLLIVGTLKGQLTTATKIAMDNGASVTHAEGHDQAMGVLKLLDPALLPADQKAKLPALMAECAAELAVGDTERPETR